MSRSDLRKTAVTDRANRYRAQRPQVRPLPPKQCGFCGSRRNIGVHHISGVESESSADNLMWACKRCNTQIGVWMKRAGLGKRVAQYNPAGSRRSQMGAYGAAIKVMRGEFEGDIGKAMETIRRTPRDIRSAYTSRTWPVRRQIYGPAGRSGAQSEIPF